MPGVALSLALSGALLAPLVEGSGLGPGWRVATLPQQKPPVTRFTPERVQGREALRVEADGSYGNLVHGPVSYTHLDVYKRQLPFGRRIARGRFPRLLSTGGGSRRPVEKTTSGRI